MNTYDVIVVGAGFYGCKIAIELKKLGVKRVLLIEQRGSIMPPDSASYVNQARIHMGYHYPRHKRTAERSFENYTRFLVEHRDAVWPYMEKYYAIAQGSLTKAHEYVAFMDKLGLPYEVKAAYTAPRLFNEKKIEAVFKVPEQVLDLAMLRSVVQAELAIAGVEVRLNTVVDDFEELAEGVTVWNDLGDSWYAKRVFVCTYANMEGTTKNPIKGENCKVVLFKAPPEIGVRHYGITIMDGDFMSVMPAPAEKCYMLTDVKLTPIMGDEKEMLKRATEYIPCMVDADYRESLVVRKAVLRQNELDDGRPILYEHSSTGRIIRVLGGKLDNIYDAIDMVHREDWLPWRHPWPNVVTTRNAVIGNGFIGKQVQKQMHIHEVYDSSNLDQMEGFFDMVVIAAPGAEKWKVNTDKVAAEEDARNINLIVDKLIKLKIKNVILISSIDRWLDTPYGKHRENFEKLVTQFFPNTLIIRLPALFGEGLKKNVLYDLLHEHRLSKINPNSTFQWYPINKLSSDISTAYFHNWKELDLVTEPIMTREIIERYFPNYGHMWDDDDLWEKRVEYNFRLPSHMEGTYNHQYYWMNTSEIHNHLGRFIAAERKRIRG